jgi:hypothetical protein
MKNIHYDVEGDILSITFAEVKDQLHTGVELTDNIVLYFNPETEEPIKLLLLSYRRLLQASAQAPLLLDGLTNLPEPLRAKVLKVVSREPVANFLRLVKGPPEAKPASRLREILTPAALRAL